MHYVLLLLLVYFALVSPQFAMAQTEPVNIPDARLRLLIEATLSKMPGQTITRAEMSLIPFINGTGVGISDLTGLEYATNLQQAYLHYNSISDLSPLKDLSNLRVLTVQGNRIADISPLANLTNLVGIILGGLGGGNLVSNLGPLANLTNLTQLALSSNMISDISPLANLTALQTLTLDDNRISNLTPLTNLTSLTGLSIGTDRGGNSVSDISPLAGLTSLTQLFLQDNSISDISDLGGLTNLRRLELQGNSITDISALVSNTGLSSGDIVDLRGNQLNETSISQHIPTLRSRGVAVTAPDFVVISDAGLLAAIWASQGTQGDSRRVTTRYGLRRVTVIEAPRNAGISSLAGLEIATLLRRVVLNGNSISDISPLVNARQLTTLELNDNRISDIPPLRGALTQLKLNGNRISDISLLEEMATLTSLDLGDNYVSDIAPLAGLTGLSELDLGGNRISDIAPLARLTGLSELDLGGNRISDIAPLARLIYLIELNLDGNRISDVAPLAGLTRLIELDLGNNYLSNLASLASLTKLAKLHLHGNEISDIGPLLGNRGLNDGDRIDLHDNVLDDESNRIHLSTLRERGVSVVNDTRISVDLQASALEGENIEFGVSLSAPIESGLKIHWDTIGNQASRGRDFAEEDATGVLSIRALDTQGIILIRTTEDDHSEQDETFDLFINLPLESEPPVGVTLNQLFGTGTILDDDRPIVREAVPNQKLAAMSNALKLELSSLFSAPADLIYEAASSDTSLAQVRVSGDLLIVRPERAGEVAITITATDGRGFKATQTFTLTIEPTAPRSHLRGWRLSLLVSDQKQEDQHQESNP